MTQKKPLLTTFFFMYSFILSNNYVSSSYKGKVKLHLKSLKCTHDPTIFNGTINCFIKPFRNGTQLATALYTFQKPCDDLWVNVVVYFKFGGTAAYRQWMFNFDENVCAILNGGHEPKLISKIIYRVTEKIAPNTIHKCPYVGEEGIRNINADEVLAGIMPHVLPTGDYRVLFRFHTASNKTFLEALFGGHIEATNPLEAITMG